MITSLTEVNIHCLYMYSSEKKYIWSKLQEKKYKLKIDIISVSLELWHYTAISRKFVGKSARDNPERYCGWFWVHCFSKKFEKMALAAMDACLWVWKESNKSRFDGYCVRNSVLIISHVTFRDCCVHIFSDNLSRNRCIHLAHTITYLKYHLYLHNLSTRERKTKERLVHHWNLVIQVSYVVKNISVSICYRFLF